MKPRRIAARFVPIVTLMVLGSAAFAEDAPNFVLSWGTSGSAPGQFGGPSAIAVDGFGNVYVGDTGNGRIQKFTSAGQFLTAWGSSGSGDGQFNGTIGGIAVDRDGDLYVTSWDRVEKFSGSGDFLGSFGTGGSGPGQFESPTGIAADANGNIYVIDPGNRRIQRLSLMGQYLGSFPTPFALDLVADVDGNLFVTVNGKSETALRKYDPSGVVLSDWPGKSFYFAVDLDPNGNVLVSDANLDEVCEYTAQGAFLTQWGTHGTGDGQFHYPLALAVGPDGSIFVADRDNDRIEKFSPPKVADVSGSRARALLEILPPTPNPSRQGARIALDLPARDRFSLVLLDVAGRTVRTLANNQGADAGRWSAHWDGRNESGALVPPGIYLLRLTSGRQMVSRKVVVAR
jgi:hypothetical protein